MMKAIKYKNEAVLIQDGKIKAWLDLWIDNDDVICDWNQNSFIMSDPNDVALKKWQDNLEHFEDAISKGSFGKCRSYLSGRNCKMAH